MKRIGLCLAVSVCLSLPLRAQEGAGGQSATAGPVMSPFLGTGLLLARFQSPGEDNGPSLLARLGSETYSARAQASVQAAGLVQGLFEDCVNAGLALGDPLRVDDCLERTAAELNGMMNAASDEEVRRRLEIALGALRNDVRETYHCYCNVVCQNPRLGNVREEGLTFSQDWSQSCRALPSDSDVLERHCNPSNFARQGLVSAACYFSAEAPPAAAEEGTDEGPESRLLDPAGPRPPGR